jgi:hypothetical protein
MIQLIVWLGFMGLLALAALLGLTADSRTYTYSYPAGPDIGDTCPDRP